MIINPMENARRCVLAMRSLLFKARAVGAQITFRRTQHQQARVAWPALDIPMRVVEMSLLACLDTSPLAKLHSVLKAHLLAARRAWLRRSLPSFRSPSKHRLLRLQLRWLVPILYSSHLLLLLIYRFWLLLLAAQSLCCGLLCLCPVLLL